MRAIIDTCRIIFVDRVARAPGVVCRTLRIDLRLVYDSLLMNYRLQMGLYTFAYRALQTHNCSLSPS